MNVKFLKVENEPCLIRDNDNKAILNTDISAIKRHEQRIKQIEKQKLQEQEINSLKDEIAEIRELLRTMMQK